MIAYYANSNSLKAMYLSTILHIVTSLNNQTRCDLKSVDIVTTINKSQHYWHLLSWGNKDLYWRCTTKRFFMMGYDIKTKLLLINNLYWYGCIFAPNEFRHINPSALSTADVCIMALDIQYIRVLYVLLSLSTGRFYSYPKLTFHVHWYNRKIRINMKSPFRQDLNHITTHFR